MVAGLIVTGPHTGLGVFVVVVDWIVFVAAAPPTTQSNDPNVALPIHFLGLGCLDHLALWAAAQEGLRLRSANHQLVAGRCAAGGVVVGYGPMVDHRLWW